MNSMNTLALIATLGLTACGGASFNQGQGDAAKRVTKQPAVSGQVMTKASVIAAFEASRKSQTPDAYVIPAESLTQFSKIAGAEKDIIVNDYVPSKMNLDGDDQDVDLRRFDSRVKNQGSTSLCTSFATVGAVENVIKRKYGKEIDLSERHLWSKYANYMTGDAVVAAERNWIVDEASWPFNSQGPVRDLTGRGLGTIDTYTVTLTRTSQIIADLADNNPVVIGVGIKSPMLLRGGVLNRYGSASDMGHAMLAVGVLFDQKFSDEGGGVIILKNSYGPTSGDQGYVYMPLNYCNSGLGRRCHAWAVRDASLKDGTPVAQNQPETQPVPQPQNNDISPLSEISAGDFSVKANMLGRSSNGNMNFTIELVADDATLKQVKSVTFKIHRSWGADYTNTDSEGPEFVTEVYGTYARGWRTDGADIELKDGRTLSIPGVLITY